MSDLNKAILKVAKSNPEFREALVAELGKQAKWVGDLTSDSFPFSYVERLMDDSKPSSYSGDSYEDSGWGRKTEVLRSSVLGLTFWRKQEAAEDHKNWTHELNGIVGVEVQKTGSTVAVSNYAEVETNDGSDGEWSQRVQRYSLLDFHDFHENGNLPRGNPSTPHLKIVVPRDKNHAELHTLWTADVRYTGNKITWKLHVSFDPRKHHV